MTELFRNKLAHEYFPMLTVSRAGHRPALRRAFENKVTLDAETLAKDFINSLETFKIKLTEELFEKRKIEFEKNMNIKYNRLKDKIKLLQAENTSQNKTYTSLASPYPGLVNFIKLP